MLDYLREKRDVSFFQSMAGLMLSCRWVTIEKVSDKTCQMSERHYIQIDRFFTLLFLCVSAIQCFGSECVWEAEQSRRIRHGYGWRLRYCIHMEIKKKNQFLCSHVIACSELWDPPPWTCSKFALEINIFFFAFLNSCLPSLHFSLIFLCSLRSESFFMFFHLLCCNFSAVVLHLLPLSLVFVAYSCHFFSSGEKVMPDKDITCDLFRFLQLLCEGHNSGYFPTWMR